MRRRARHQPDQSSLATTDCETSTSACIPIALAIEPVTIPSATSPTCGPSLRLGLATECQHLGASRPRAVVGAGPFDLSAAGRSNGVGRALGWQIAERGEFCFNPRPRVSERRLVLALTNPRPDFQISSVSAYRPSPVRAETGTTRLAAVKSPGSVGLAVPASAIGRDAGCRPAEAQNATIAIHLSRQSEIAYASNRQRDGAIVHANGNVFAAHLHEFRPPRHQREVLTPFDHG